MNRTRPGTLTRGRPVPAAAPLLAAGPTPEPTVEPPVDDTLEALPPVAPARPGPRPRRPRRTGHPPTSERVNLAAGLAGAVRTRGELAPERTTAGRTGVELAPRSPRHRRRVRAMGGPWGPPPAAAGAGAWPAPPARRTNFARPARASPPSPRLALVLASAGVGAAVAIAVHKNNDHACSQPPRLPNGSNGNRFW